MRLVEVSTVLLAAMPAACSSIGTEIAYDPAAPFSQYKTYSFARSNQARGLASQIPTLIDLRNAITRNLNEKGLKSAASTHADLLVKYDTTTVLKQDDEHNRYCADNAYRKPDYCYPSSSDRYPYFKEETLTLKLLDAITGKVVWQGTATSKTEDQTEASQKSISEAVTKLFKTYPPN